MSSSSPLISPATVHFRPEIEPDPADVAVLESRLSDQMLQTSGHAPPMEMANFIRDGSDRVRGGVYGWTWGGCCELQHLWVDEELRSNGFGGQMLAWAEEEARARGCTQVVLFTHGSQSPQLYARRGYHIVGRVDGYPVGDTALWFQKLL